MDAKYKLLYYCDDLEWGYDPRSYRADDCEGECENGCRYCSGNEEIHHSQRRDVNIVRPRAGLHRPTPIAPAPQSITVLHSISIHEWREVGIYLGKHGPLGIFLEKSTGRFVVYQHDSTTRRRIIYQPSFPTLEKAKFAIMKHFMDFTLEWKPASRDVDKERIELLEQKIAAIRLLQQEVPEMQAEIELLRKRREALN